MKVNRRLTGNQADVPEHGAGLDLTVDRDVAKRLALLIKPGKDSVLKSPDSADLSSLDIFDKDLRFDSFCIWLKARIREGVKLAARLCEKATEAFSWAAPRTRSGAERSSREVWGEPIAERPPAIPKTRRTGVQ